MTRPKASLSDKPFFYRIYSGEHLLQTLRHKTAKARAEFALEFAQDLSAGEGRTEYTRGIIQETVDYIRSKREAGKKGGNTTSRRNSSRTAEGTAEGTALLPEGTGGGGAAVLPAVSPHQYRQTVQPVSFSTRESKTKAGLETDQGAVNALLQQQCRDYEEQYHQDQQFEVIAEKCNAKISEHREETEPEIYIGNEDLYL